MLGLDKCCIANVAWTNVTWTDVAWTNVAWTNVNGTRKVKVGSLSQSSKLELGMSLAIRIKKI